MRCVAPILCYAGGVSPTPKRLPRLVRALVAWREAETLDPRGAVDGLNRLGLRVTLEQWDDWEGGRKAPRGNLAKALDKFVGLPPTVRRLLLWRKRNGLSQRATVEIMARHNVTVKLSALQDWEQGPRKLKGYAAQLIDQFLQDHPTVEPVVIPRGRRPQKP